MSKRNGHVRDEQIVLNNNSKPRYIINGVPALDYISVTNLVEKGAKGKPVDRMRVAALRVKTTDQNSPNYGISQADLVNKWDASEKAGTHMHANIERYYDRKSMILDGHTLPEDYTLPDEAMWEWRFFLNFDKSFIDANEYEIYRVEWCMFDEASRICGTADAVFRNKTTGKFMLVDWKRSEVISKGTRKFTPSKLKQYFMQVNVYAEILSRMYNLTIDQLLLVVLHPNGDDYECIHVPIDNTIGSMINDRIAENNSISNDIMSTMMDDDLEWFSVDCV